MTTASICPRTHGEGGLGRPQRSWGALWACAVNGKDLTQHALATTADLGSAASLDAGAEPGNVAQLDASGRLPAPLGAVAPGTVLAFAGAGPPEGYLECDGASVSRAAYAALFAAIGTAFGAGDGSTTFALPDLRGEFVRGWDHGRGVDAGRSLGSAQGDAIRNITGEATRTGTYGLLGTDAGNVTGCFELGTATSGIVGNGSGAGRWLAFDASNVVPTADENRPRNVALMHIIKY